LRSTPLLTLLLVFVPLSVDAQLALDDALVLDPRTRMATLPNGLRYYIRVNQEPRDRAELRLVVDVGSILEDEDQRGLAHFAEHMAFNGTRDFEAQELVDYLETIGMRFGADVNAYTSFDETVYMLTVPTDKDTLLEQGFRVLENWARWVMFDAEEIEKERGVVIEEWRIRRGAAQRIRDKQNPILYHNSRYAERMPIGTKENLESFDHETLRRYYQDWYRPELMAVIAVGDFDAAEVEDFIRTYFSSLPSSDPPRQRPTYVVPEHPGTLFAIATDEEATRSSVTLFTKFPTRDRSTVRAYREGIVESLYRSMLNARMAELTQRENPPFIGGGAFRTNLVRPVEGYGLGVSVENNGMERGLEAVLVEAERASRHGFTATELERAKKQLTSSIERRYNERDKTDSAVFAGGYARHFLSDDPATGIEFAYEAHQEFVPEIQLEEVDALSRQWNVDRNRVVLASGPEKHDVNIPDENELRGVIARVAALDIEPYVDKTKDSPLIARLPDPGKIVDEESLRELGIELWTLSNGVRVYLKPTDFKDDEVLMRAWSEGGSSLVSDEMFLTGARGTWMVSRCGVGDFNPTELRKELAGKQVRVFPWVSELGEGMQGSTRPQDLETLFQLTYLHFTSPRHDPTAFNALRTRFRGVLENRAAEPNVAFQDTLSLALSQNHPRSQPMNAESLDRIVLDDAFEVLRERFADASDFTFAFVGNLDLQAMRSLVRTYLGGLPSLDRDEKWRDVGRRPPTGLVRRSFRRGVENKARTVIVFTGPARWGREHRYALNAMVEALRIRLREVLREDLGGTYGVGVSGSLDRDPETRYSVEVGFGCDPERLEELSAQVFEVVESLQQDGIDDEIVTKIAEIQRNGYEEGLRQNEFWLSQIQFRDSHGADLHEILDYEKFPNALSTKQVRDAARRYLRTDNFVQISMYPEDYSGTPDDAAKEEQGAKGGSGSRLR
jgi:zinc protease